MAYYEHLKLEDIFIYDQISLDTIYKTLDKNEIKLIKREYTNIYKKNEFIIQGKEHPIDPKLILIRIIEKIK